MFKSLICGIHLILKIPSQTKRMEFGQIKEFNISIPSNFSRICSQTPPSSSGNSSMPLKFIISPQSPLVLYEDYLSICIGKDQFFGCLIVLVHLVGKIYQYNQTSNFNFCEIDIKQ